MGGCRGRCESWLLRLSAADRGGRPWTLVAVHGREDPRLPPGGLVMSGVRPGPRCGRRQSGRRTAVRARPGRASRRAAVRGAPLQSMGPLPG